MIRGIRFKLAKINHHILESIISGIDVLNYHWVISDNEVFQEPNWDFLFIKEEYTGEELIRMICDHNYSVVFLSMMAFPKNKQNQSNEIQTYTDFLKSNCALILIISDSVFVDVYSKKVSELEIIKANAHKQECEELEYITDHNDSRTNMKAI